MFPPFWQAPLPMFVGHWFLGERIPKLPSTAMGSPSGHPDRLFLWRHGAVSQIDGLIPFGGYGWGYPWVPQKSSKSWMTIYEYWNDHDDLEIRIWRNPEKASFHRCFSTWAWWDSQSCWWQALMKKHIDRAKVELGQGGGASAGAVGWFFLGVWWSLTSDSHGNQWHLYS